MEIYSGSFYWERKVFPNCIVYTNKRNLSFLYPFELFYLISQQIIKGFLCFLLSSKRNPFSQVIDQWGRGTFFILFCQFERKYVVWLLNLYFSLSETMPIEFPFPRPETKSIQMCKDNLLSSRNWYLNIKRLHCINNYGP